MAVFEEPVTDSLGGSGLSDDVAPFLDGHINLSPASQISPSPKRQDGEQDIQDQLSQALWNPISPTLPIPVALHRFRPVGLNRRGPVAFSRFLQVNF